MLNKIMFLRNLAWFSSQILLRTSLEYVYPNFPILERFSVCIYHWVTAVTFICRIPPSPVFMSAIIFGHVFIHCWKWNLVISIKRITRISFTKRGKTTILIESKAKYYNTGLLDTVIQGYRKTYDAESQ